MSDDELAVLMQQHPELIDLIQNSIDELQNGNGKTYFEIILEIIESHSNIELVTK